MIETNDASLRSNVIFKTGYRIPKIIGLTGKARSGKDTVAAYLTKVYGYEQLAFAAALKKGIRAMFDLDTRFTDGEFKEDVIPWIGKSPRQMMQSLGTEWGRNCVKDSLWTDLIEFNAKALNDAGVCVVVSDVRFDNEADMIRRNGGVVMHIDRPDVKAVAQHASEAGIKADGKDMFITNDGTLDQLYSTVDYVLSTF